MIESRFSPFFLVVVLAVLHVMGGCSAAGSSSSGTPAYYSNSRTGSYSSTEQALFGHCSAEDCLFGSTNSLFRGVADNDGDVNTVKEVGLVNDVKNAAMEEKESKKVVSNKKEETGFAFMKDTLPKAFFHKNP